MELVKDQLAILVNRDEGDVIGSKKINFGAVLEIYDDFLLFVKEDGGFHVYRGDPSEGDVVFPMYEDGEPVLVKKTLFGKYKFPKAKVAK
jgi:hypothetical protein